MALRSLPRLGSRGHLQPRAQPKAAETSTATQHSPPPKVPQPTPSATVGASLVFALVGASVTGTLARTRRQKLETLTKQLQEANRQLRVERRRERKKQLDQNDSNDSSDLGRHRSRLSEVIQQLQTGKRALRNEDVALAEQQFSAALDMIAADESKGVNEPNYVYAVERRKALRGLGAAKRLVGDTRAALRYYSRVLEVSETVGDHHGDADVCGTLADLYAELNDFDNAAVYYDRLISCMTNQEYYTEDVSSDAAAEDDEVEVETRL